MIKVGFFDSHPYDEEYFKKCLKGDTNLEFSFFNHRLNQNTAATCVGFDAVCCFVNDKLDKITLQKLKDNGVRLIALRCAGFNNVDLAAAETLGLPVVRVPAYSPYAVAEHALALLLTVNRKTHRAYNRVKELNFSLNGLVGFDLHGKTVGVIGTGKIGEVFVKIMRGLGCHVLLYDITENPNLVGVEDVEYVALNELFKRSQIISLHVPLNSQTKHIINSENIELMQEGVILVNTGRGALVDTKALIKGLKSKKIRAACLDVYEEEEGVFFEDHSTDVLQDDDLARLLTFPNVIISSHQAFLTEEALDKIADTTIGNIKGYFEDHKIINGVVK